MTNYVSGRQPEELAKPEVAVARKWQLGVQVDGICRLIEWGADVGDRKILVLREIGKLRNKTSRTLEIFLSFLLGQHHGQQEAHANTCSSCWR